MNKKFLLVLPLITLVAGCGVKKTNIYELPKGGRDVNFSDEDDILYFRDLINEALIKSADALLSKAQVGLSIEHLSGHVYDQHISYDKRSKEEVLEAWETYAKFGDPYFEENSFEVDVDDLCLDLGINAWGLGGNVGDITAQVDLSASGAISFAQKYEEQYDKTDEKEIDESSAEASTEGGKLTAWLQDGTILLDATDKKILEFAAPIAGTISDPSNPNAFNGLVNLLTGKWSISGLIPDDVLENTLIEDIDQLSTMLEAEDPGAFFCALLAPEFFPEIGSAEAADMFTDIFTCKVYEDNSIGVQGTITGEWANEAFGFRSREDGSSSWKDKTDTKVTEDSWATVTVLFNKDLYLSSIGVQVSANFIEESAYASLYSDTNSYFYYDNIDILAEGSVGLTFDFNPKEVKLPNISNFQELDLNGLPF